MTNPSLLADELIERSRKRRDHLQAEIALYQRIHAIGRRVLNLSGELDAGARAEADRLAKAVTAARAGRGHPQAEAVREAADTIVAAHAMLRETRKECERGMAETAKRLPVWSAFVEDLPGVTALGLANVIGETGDLAAYPSPRHVWKRMGLALVEEDGALVRQGKRSAREAAARHGYSPRRRAVAYTIGEAFKKLREGPYRKVYDERRAHMEARAAEEAKPIVPHAEAKKKGLALGDYYTPQQLDRDAMRVATKTYLRDLWRAWGQAHGETEAA